MKPTARAKWKRRLWRVLGLLLGLVLGWWAGAKLTDAAMENGDRPATTRTSD